jgi:hypothetical protein
LFIFDDNQHPLYIYDLDLNKIFNVQKSKILFQINHYSFKKPFITPAINYYYYCINFFNENNYFHNENETLKFLELMKEILIFLMYNYEKYFSDYNIFEKGNESDNDDDDKDDDDKDDDNEDDDNEDDDNDEKKDNIIFLLSSFECSHGKYLSNTKYVFNKINEITKKVEKNKLNHVLQIENSNKLSIIKDYIRRRKLSITRGDIKNDINNLFKTSKKEVDKKISLLNITIS